MRILHTSDWHLGRTLEGRSRIAEQAEFIEQICLIARDEGVHLVLVAGDVYDTHNPSAEAEELFFDAVERLADGGERAVIVIAGNHDSPDRIRAANPLALKHSICLIGYPREELPCGPAGGGKVIRLSTGKGWSELAISGCAESAVVYSLAYPSESRLNEVLSEDMSDRAQQAAYADRLRALFEEADSLFRDDSVNIVAGHIFVSGGWECDSERQIQVGGSLPVEPQLLPGKAHYIALGHLHRPQQVSSSRAPCRYSGSPLAYSFSEADQQKEVVLVDAVPGRAAVVKPVNLTCGRPLKAWKAENLDEVYSLCREPRNLDCWVDLEVKAQQPLTAAQLGDLRRAHPGIVNIKVILPEVAAGEAESRRLSEMSLTEQFRLFAVRGLGREPEPELTDLFLKLLAGEDDGVEADGVPGEDGGNS